jgi:diaminopimelate decarboxylase
MEPFEYRGGELFAEERRVSELADQFGTPLFVYSRAALLAHYARLAGAFAALRPHLCFSIKSCHNLHLLRLLRERGAWFDAVSIGEVRRALEAGADARHVVFAGVGKTETEIREAVAAGVGCFNVESPAELEVLARVAEETDRPVRAALRVNPDVDPATHPYTTTGKKENKFGIEMDEARRLFLAYAGHSRLRLSGLHLHIGSPVPTVAPYVEAVGKALTLVDELRRCGVAMEVLNIGGGWAVSYGDRDTPPLEDYAAALLPLLAERGLDIHLEPGRSIAANAGLLVTRVTYLKQGKARRFVIVDAAMTDLIRPALYQAYHFVWPVKPAGGAVPENRRAEVALPGLSTVDVVGPVCESSDFLAKDRALPQLRAGDLLAVFSAGAYGAVMGSQYNSRPRPAEVLVEGASARLIRRRETYDDLVRTEREVGEPEGR